MAIEQNTFDSASVSLDQENFGKIPESQFDTAMAKKMQEDIAESLTPEDIKPSDANKVDVQLQGNIAVNLRKKDLFTGDLSTFEDPDAESASDKIDAIFKSSSPFTTDPTKFSNVGRGTGPDAVLKPVGISGKTAEEELAEKADELDPDTPPPMGELDLQQLVDPAKRYAIKGYESIRDYFGFGPDYAGQAMQTVPSVFGQGYNLAKYGTQFKTGLGTTTAQSSVGLSGAPPSSLAAYSTAATPQLGSGVTAAGTFAGTGYGSLQPNYTGLGTSSATAAATRLGGPGVNPLGQPMYGSSAAKSGPWGTLGTLLSVYGIADSAQKGDWFGAGTSFMTLVNPTTAVPLAALTAVKFALGAWMGSKKPKPAFGGAEFKTSKNSLMATRGWGYNAYNKAAGQAMVASVADYVNSYTKHFNLQFNGTRWADAIKNDPKMNRYDTTNDSGYADPSVLSRKIFETKGLITGTPSVGGVPITSQEDYQAKVENFNKWYKETALERGGLVDAKRVGINQQLSNEWTEVPFASRKEVTAPGGGQYTTRTVGATGRGGQGGVQQAGYWVGAGRGTQGTWVPAPQNVSVVQDYYKGSYGVAYDQWTEDATPYDMIYKNLVGKFPRGSGGTNYG